MGNFAHLVVGGQPVSRNSSRPPPIDDLPFRTHLVQTWNMSTTAFSSERFGRERPLKARTLMSFHTGALTFPRPSIARPTNHKLYAVVDATILTTVSSHASRLHITKLGCISSTRVPLDICLGMPSCEIIDSMSYGHLKIPTCRHIISYDILLYLTAFSVRIFASPCSAPRTVLDMCRGHDEGATRCIRCAPIIFVRGLELPVVGHHLL